MNNNFQLLSIMKENVLVKKGKQQLYFIPFQLNLVRSLGQRLLIATTLFNEPVETRFFYKKYDR